MKYISKKVHKFLINYKKASETNKKIEIFESRDN